MFKYRILLKEPLLQDYPSFYLKEIIFESEKNYDVRQGDARLRLINEYLKWQINTASALEDEPESYAFSVLKEEKVA